MLISQLLDGVLTPELQPTMYTSLLHVIAMLFEHSYEVGSPTHNIYEDYAAEGTITPIIYEDYAAEPVDTNSTAYTTGHSEGWAAAVAAIESGNYVVSYSAASGAAFLLCGFA